MPKRSHVVVEGLLLSREAIEKAVQELNAPDPTPSQGDVVCLHHSDGTIARGSEYLILSDGRWGHLWSGDVGGAGRLGPENYNYKFLKKGRDLL